MGAGSTPRRTRRNAMTQIHRRVTAGLVALGMLAAPVAQAATRCASEPEQFAFEVTALKSDLMVVGLLCEDNDRYSAFIERYRPELIAADRNLEQHFARLKGRAGPRAKDTYITNLAQAQGFQAQRLGSDHCPRNRGIFAEVMALPGGSELAAYAAAKDLVPATLGACEPPTPPAPARASRAKPKRS